MIRKAICIMLSLLLVLAGTAFAQGSGTLYTGRPSENAGGYCVLSPNDALRLEPDDTFTGTVTYQSTCPDVADVEDGLVRPRSAGVTDIVISDGTHTSLCRVMVEETPVSVTPAGALLIDIDGTVYEPGFSAADWAALGKKPQTLPDTDTNQVFLVNGIFYVRSACLFNAVCGRLGKCTAVAGRRGGLAQLCGDCAIETADVATEITLCGDSTALYTFPRLFCLPDGEYVGWDMYTLIAENDTVVRTVCYDCINIEGELYENAAAYLEAFGIACETEYDEAGAVLTLKLLPKED